MEYSYDRCVRYWDAVFEQEAPLVPQSCSTGNPAFDRSLDWLTEGAERILDFGCGNGTLLFLCALRGTSEHTGIDLSPKAIESAQRRSSMMRTGQFTFLQGSLERLKELPGQSLDAVLLSNILDNLYPEDAIKLLMETQRLLKPNGRVLLKLNPFLSPQQIREWKISVIRDNLLDDGLLLWNNSAQQWTQLIGKYLHILSYEEIYYEEYQQSSRLFLAVKETEK